MTTSRRKFMATVGIGTLAAQIKSNALAQAMNRTGLKDYYANDFKIGTAIGSDILEKKELR